MLPQFKYPLTTKQRNIGVALIAAIGTITVVCVAYLEVMYEMTLELYITTIISGLCSIVTGIIVLMNAYDIEKALDNNKSEFETIATYKKEEYVEMAYLRYH